MPAAHNRPSRLSSLFSRLTLVARIALAIAAALAALAIALVVTRPSRGHDGAEGRHRRAGGSPVRQASPPPARNAFARNAFARSSGPPGGRLQRAPQLRTPQPAGPHAAAAGSRRRSPRSLPQTSALPSSHTLAFRREMTALWQAIVADRPRLGRPAFFPRGAYLQLKAIAGAGFDYEHRLLYDYALDIRAAHALLGRGARSASLLNVRVPSSYAHWVPPGVCYNRVGYYEVPNSRIVYSERRKTRSFGIASIISSRGVWYVVHLGAILRSGAEGVVDQPATGPGVSEPSSTC